MAGMKRIAAFILASVLLLAAGCTQGNVRGSVLADNIARIYTPGDRTSRFVHNGAAIDGTVVGKAYFNAAADGRTALAWVDRTLYFVSDKGVDLLGSGIGAAEISKDGGSALFLDGDVIYRYSLETRGTAAVDEGVESVVQFAFSPSGDTFMFTARYSSESGAYRTRLFKDGRLLDAEELSGSIVLAVNDAADIIYYYDAPKGAFSVLTEDGSRVISEECGPVSRYDFTNDLGEVIFSTEDGKEIWYRLSDGSAAELGTGFGYSLGTDVFSISTLTLFTYIYDTSSFADGLYMLRKNAGDAYIYSIGRLSRDGRTRILVENALKYEIPSDGSRIVWLGTDGLFSTDLNGGTKALASDAEDFALSEDGNAVCYVSAAGELFRVSGNRAAEKLDSRVDSLCWFKGRCFYIKDRTDGVGTLCSSDGRETRITAANAVRFSRRAGQLLVYTDPVGYGDREIYSLLISADGNEFFLAAEGVEP